MGKDTVFGENIKGKRINALLVDNDKVLLLLVAAYGLVTDKVLELDDLPALGVRESAFRLDEFFPLLGRGIEEA